MAASDTGQSATIAFGTSAFTAVYQQMGEIEQTRDALEDTDLSVTGEKTYVPSDVFEPGTLTCTLYFDPTDGLPGPGSAAETITLTYPKSESGTVSAANLAGSGFITSVKYPSLQLGEINMAEFTIQFDGKTGPTFTAEA